MNNILAGPVACQSNWSDSQNKMNKENMNINLNVDIGKQACIQTNKSYKKPLKELIINIIIIICYLLFLQKKNRKYILYSSHHKFEWNETEFESCFHDELDRVVNYDVNNY